MALDPTPVDGMAVMGYELVQLLPEINIFDGLFCSRFPALGFPPRQPLRDAFQNILAVNMQGHRTGAFERQKGLNYGHHFHAVIGRVQLTAKQFFFAAIGLTQ